MAGYAGLAVVGLAFVLPLLGPLLAAGAGIVSPAIGRRLWPHASRRSHVLAGVAVALVVWLPLFVVVAGLPSAYLWLIVPLCGPATTAGWLVPSALALAVYGAGSTASVARGRVWLWPAAAFAALWAYELAAYALGVEMVC